MAPDAFTEAEHKGLAEFINFVFTNASWELKSAQAFEFVKHYRTAADILKKIEKHIFEVVKTINNEPTKEEPAKEPATKKAK